MDGELATPACLVGRLGTVGKAEPGELRLKGDLVAFTSDDRGLVFQAPRSEVRASFPRRYFGLGAKLCVRDKTYRLWFVPLRSRVGEETSDGMTVVAGNSFPLKSVGPAREATRRWRAALEQPTHSR